MGETVGSQIFGSWYDLLGWALGAAFWFYFAVAGEHMPAQKKEKLPAFILNKKVCIAMGIFLLLLGTGKALKWW